ncbi:MAG: hypothetical protein ABSF71_00100 [Terriglobia bacterium]
MAERKDAVWIPQGVARRSIIRNPGRGDFKVIGNLSDVARASRPLARGHPARAIRESGTLSPQRAGRPRYAPFLITVAHTFNTAAVMNIARAASRSTCGMGCLLV